MKPENLHNAQQSLLLWYEKNGRHDLLWRNTDNIYHIYVSEIMLQQTQVKRVMEEYYPQFLARFPSLQALAEATESEVLSVWSGLGYYSRARNLHATAKLCPKALPATMKELQKLPGIGRYTASAICSFGYHQKVGVADTNIARLLKRFFAITQGSDEVVYNYAEQFVNAQNSRAHNLALMDLGSLVCLPKNPKCQECPLFSTCQGKDEPELYTQKQKKVYEELELYYGMWICDGKIALRKSSGKMYKGLLELPSVEPVEEDFIAEFKHSYTKYKLRVKLYSLHELEDDIEWLSFEEANQAHISSLTKKALRAFTKVHK